MAPAIMQIPRPNAPRSWGFALGFLALNPAWFVQLQTRRAALD